MALKYESEINDDRLPEIIYWLDYIKDELKGFCDLMKIILNPYNSSTVGLTRNSAIWQNDNDVSSLGKNLFKLFRLSVCMTTIDLKYYANPHNRKSLIELIDIIRISLDVPESILQFLKDSGDEDSLFASVLGDLQFKACNLLNGMLNDKYEDALKFRIISKEIKDIVEQNVIDSENITNPFTFVYLHGTCHDYDKLREDIIDKNRIEYNDANRTDLTSYNRYLDVSYMAYCKISSMYDRKSLDRLDKDGVLYDRLDELLVDANDVNIYSSTFFATVIPYVYDKMENQDKKRENQDKKLENPDKNWYVLLCRLFLKCREYIQIYRHWHNIPLVYRPLFECSIVKRSGRELVSEKFTSEIIDNYGSGGVKDNVVKGIFFASLGYESIDISHLENLLFRYNNKWHIKMGDNMQQQLDKIIDTRKGVIDAQDELNKTLGSIPEQFVDERKRTVQLLGIFGAMLAFVSSVIGMQKIVKSSLDFALFCCMFVMCLLIFVLG
ncbi:MAG: hypothetical protein J6B62_11125, partial [Bacteroidales bacterium]|nr:hypothetical protein [Bacteroidales bacterium]